MPKQQTEACVDNLKYEIERLKRIITDLETCLIEDKPAAWGEDCPALSTPEYKALEQEGGQARAVPIPERKKAVERK